MSSMLVFVDTNTFVHFRSIREVDWRQVLQTPTVELIVTQAVLRELDDIKENPKRHRKIRERAASALRLVKALVQNPHIRDGVLIRFHHHDPQIDFALSKLSIQVVDDWIIAAILEHRQANPDSVIRLLTADEALQVKANGHTIAHFELPEAYRLPQSLMRTKNEFKNLN
jgi:rRNA-processing protein FCF1